MEVSLLYEAREIVRTQPMNLKVGHLKKCADAADKAYRDLCWKFTREAARDFAAHTARLILAIEMVQADEPNTPRGGKVEQPKPTATVTAHGGV